MWTNVTILKEEISVINLEIDRVKYIAEKVITQDNFPGWIMDSPVHDYYDNHVFGTTFTHSTGAKMLVLYVQSTYYMASRLSIMTGATSASHTAGYSMVAGLCFSMLPKEFTETETFGSSLKNYSDLLPEHATRFIGTAVSPHSVGGVTAHCMVGSITDLVWFRYQFYCHPDRPFIGVFCDHNRSGTFTDGEDSLRDKIAFIIGADAIKVQDGDSDGGAIALYLTSASKGYSNSRSEAEAFTGTGINRTFTIDQINFSYKAVYDTNMGITFVGDVYFPNFGHFGGRGAEQAYVTGSPTMGFVFSGLTSFLGNPATGLTMATDSKIAWSSIFIGMIASIPGKLPANGGFKGWIDPALLRLVDSIGKKHGEILSNGLTFLGNFLAMGTPDQTAAKGSVAEPWIEY